MNQDKRKNIFRKGIGDVIRIMVTPVIFTAIMIGMITYGLQQTEEANRAEGLRILEDSIRRAVVTAYAVEGRYPANLAHIENNYGVFIDRTRYVVHYTVFSSTIMPNISVFELR